ncbi:MAG: hypothetical protein TREMPRED_003456 [Tremellales sp. Tagirdzhanova-0007]|nr:MAG: hypothetical protein TREMPRED_003456 [Tremellales sp. Tagirdzhanova-0007]
MPNLQAMTMSPPAMSGLKTLSLVAAPRWTNGEDDTRVIPGPATPRRTRGLRSSISYSPAPRISREIRYPIEVTREDDRIGGVEKEKEVKVRDDSGDCTAGKGERQREVCSRTPTLTERHADLLTLIAQRERRVNELRQELIQQEASLSQLKSRWRTIVSKSSIPIPYQSTSIPLNSLRPTSTSSQGSSYASLVLPPGLAIDEDATPTFAGLLQSALGPSEEAYEGGKKFWGQLVKTVSAAAGGTVPPPVEGIGEGVKEEGEGESAAGRLDLSGLKTMLPAWNNMTIMSPSSQPPRPANASRLQGPREMRQLSTSGSSGSSRSLMDDDGEERYGSEAVLTPKKEAAGRVDVSLVALSGHGKSEEEEAEDGEDSWGW